MTAPPVHEVAKPASARRERARSGSRPGTATHAGTEARCQPAPSRTPPGSGRRCSCGGLTGPDGLCDRCRRARRAQGAAPTAAGARFGHDFGCVSVEKRPGVAHGPGGPTNEFEDYPPAWQPEANAAQRLGASWVANVINGISNLPAPIPATVSALLDRHFHTTYDKDIRKIVGHYRQISDAINSAIDFECETECDNNVHAYVYGVWTDVHLCPLWFKAGPKSQANTIVHELAHDAADRDDEAYIWEAEYKTLSVDDAMDNADSYSHFAEEAYGP